MGLQAVIACVVAATVALFALLALGSGEHAEPDAAAARDAALQWTGATASEAPRRVGDSWEVDVRRPNGSLVEVTLGPALELRELDEELGPGGSPAHDQVTGRLRARAVAAARPAGGAGAVRSVERERDGTIEVDFAAPGEIVKEVELDRHLRVKDVDEEDTADE